MCFGISIRHMHRQGCTVVKGSCSAAASKGETGIQDAASADAADMIARAKAKAKQLEGPGISVLHEASFQHNKTPHPAL